MAVWCPATRQECDQPCVGSVCRKLERGAGARKLEPVELAARDYSGAAVDNRSPVCSHGVTVGTYCAKCLSTLALWEQVNMHGRAISDAEEAIEELAIGIERVAGATEEALTLIKWTRFWLWGVVLLQLVELACLIRLAGGK